MDLSSDFFRLARESQMGNFKSLPESAKNYIYLLVPGLYSNNFGCRHMRDNLEHLYQTRLDIRRININTSDTVEQNAETVKNYISREAVYAPNKKFVIIGHSKGGVDAGTAIAKYHLYGYIHAFILLQTPWYGTPVTEIQGSKIFHGVMSWFTKSKPECLSELSYSHRNWMLSKYPLDTSAVKTISCVSYINQDKSLFYFIPEFTIRTNYQILNDGVITPNDGIIPGTDYIIIPEVTHNQTVIAHCERSSTDQLSPGDYTYALIVLSLTT